MAIGFLNDLVEDVRIVLDDSGIGAKWTDAKIVRMAGMAFRRAWREIDINSTHRIVLIHEIEIKGLIRRYELPPIIGEIVTMGEWNDDLGTWKWTANSPSRYAPYRRGLHIDGNRLQFDAKPERSYTLRIEYIPAPLFGPHTGQIDFSNVKYSDPVAGKFPGVDKTLQSATTVSNGEVRYQKDGYVGQMIRIWPDAETQAQVVQERIITAQSLTPGGTDELHFTVDMDWDTIPGSTETWNYEILPKSIEGFRQVIFLGTAMTLCAMSGLRAKNKDITLEYMSAVRTEKLWDHYHSKQTPQGKYRTDSREAYAAGLYP